MFKFQAQTPDMNESFGSTAKDRSYLIKSKIFEVLPIPLSFSVQRLPQKENIRRGA